MSGRIAICGAVAQKAFQAGHTWQFLQYLLGFRRLGWDVLFIDRLAGEVAPTILGSTTCSTVMRQAGLADAWTIGLDRRLSAGVPRHEVLRRVRDADLLLNVMGFCADEEILGAARRRVFLDTDPRLRADVARLGLADVFAGHDAYVTIGERIGAPDCTIPTCGLRGSRRPSRWCSMHGRLPGHPPVRAVSRASRAGAEPTAPSSTSGHRYGLRVHQFRRFATLPRLTGAPFELALDIHPAEVADISLLSEAGGRLLDPARVASTPRSYHRYVRASGRS